MEIPY